MFKVAGGRALLRFFVYGVVIVFAPIATAIAQSKAPTAPFQDCSDCPVMVPIAPSSFTMGVPPGEEEREKVPIRSRGWSEPQHRITIQSGFALAKYDVTRAEFAAFVAATNYDAGDKCWGFTNNKEKDQWGFQEEQSGRNWRNPGFAQTERDPVVCISWNDAKAFVAWLAKKTGKGYRLPSEVEWEYAARAGSPAARYWGDDRSEAACRYANVADLTMFKTLDLPIAPERNFNCADGYTYTSPVGSFEANSFGLYDMLGNVWQWTEDCWNPNYQLAPSDGSAWVKGDCGRRVVRGASWGSYLRSVRSGNRGGDNSGFRETNNGFRVALTL